MPDLQIHYDVPAGGDLATHYARGESRPITVVGNPVLHERCADVTDFGDDLARLVSDLFASMRTARGVGLAANQIGVPLRVFVYLCPESYDRAEDEVWHAGHVVNPVVEVTGDGTGAHAEGCLSVPGARAVVPRAARVTVRGFDLAGNPVEVTGRDLLARCFQHETDHLDGHLYLDHLTAEARETALGEMSEPAYPVVPNPTAAQDATRS
ncbi:peptide deformylase [Amycolatopsis viridis]|uniref:Peptide deformylase n=1 Tax=Amycolatopsis viridis TaxID=185678 RepID=A0ABX0SQA6_9PSEU|nr:peptide deformylase [Amycolatopsis viridis]NIH79151.1 peptide deformylase [Amycolatopsis viridis]